MIKLDGQPIIFMKVGRHAGETFEDIIERKRSEYRKAGRIFWGYGGGTMEPITKVQPFAKMRVKEGKDIVLVMQEINSNHPDTEAKATQYSIDGQVWLDIPDGIDVRGSRYAVVLDEIQEGDLLIDLSAYAVGIGPSAGRVASDYIRGRVDKGCLDFRGLANDPSTTSKIVKANYVARVVPPFAVKIRNDK